MNPYFFLETSLSTNLPYLLIYSLASSHARTQNSRAVVTTHTLEEEIGKELKLLS